MIKKSHEQVNAANICYSQVFMAFARFLAAHPPMNKQCGNIFTRVSYSKSTQKHMYMIYIVLVLFIFSLRC